MTTTPTLQQLQRGLAISEQIAALESELASIFNGATSVPTAKAAPAQADGRSGKRSAATVAKMKASQQARWAKVQAPAVAAKAPAKKGGMSAEGRARIVAAQKARWAKIKGTKTPATSSAKAPRVTKSPAKAPAAPKTLAKQKRKPMSPEAKAKLGAALKARWAARKAAK